MKIAVVGAGAMGSLYAGMLARSGKDVWLVGRSPAHVDAIRADGLRMVVPGEGEWRVPLRATTDPTEIGPVDVAIFLTKIYDIGSAAVGARALFGADTLALPLANGLGAPEAIRAILPDAPLATGVSEIGGDIDAPGRLTITENVTSGRGFTRFGSHSGAVTRGRLEALAAILEDSGLRADVVADIRVPIWTKLAMAGCMSSLSALTHLRMGPIALSDEGWATLTQLFGEVAAVAGALDIALDPEALLDRARGVFSAVPNHVPSMAADLRAGRRTENDALLGAVARLGKATGVPTPACDMASRLIALIDARPGEAIW